MATYSPEENQWFPDNEDQDWIRMDTQEYPFDFQRIELEEEVIYVNVYIDSYDVIIVSKMTEDDLPF